MSEKEYPYQNLSLESLLGEIWEDIPGLEGYYSISNFGRVKRSQFEMQYKNGAIYVKPDKIIKPTVLSVGVKLTKDTNSFLTFRVGFQKHQYTFTVARLVYYCFVQNFDLENKDLVVLCKDTNNFNIVPENLVLVNRFERSKRMLERNRFRSPFHDMPQELRSRNLKLINEKNQKTVSQYDQSGKRIARFNSMAEAYQKTGIHYVSISRVARGEDLTAGGYIWRWGEEKHIDPLEYKKLHRTAFVEKYGRMVTQYSLNGTKMAVFKCVADAAKAVGVHPTRINAMLKGTCLSAGGYLWLEGDGPDSIDVSNKLVGVKARAKTHCIAVLQLNERGEVVAEYNSLKDAASANGLKPSQICDMLKGRRKHTNGFTWKYRN